MPARPFWEQDLSAEGGVLSLSPGRRSRSEEIVTTPRRGDCPSSSPRNSVLCRLRLTERATREWRVRPIYSSGGQYANLPVPRTVSGSNQRRMGEGAVGAALYPELIASRKELSDSRGGKRAPSLGHEPPGRRSCIRRKEAEPGAKKPVPAAALSRRRASKSARADEA